MLEKREYSPAPVVTKVESSSTSLDTSMMTTSTTRKSKKDKNKRRFSDEQIRQLETMFESESKLEPRTKLQLARELDLQPRQIAIWFQNRRARWKSKQLERDYSLLKADYDALASQFESLKKEKQSLVIQLQKLNNMLGNGNSTDGDSDNGETKSEPQPNPSLSLEGMELRPTAYSDDENCKNVYLGEQEDVDFTNAMDPANRILATPGNWSSFDSTGLLDQSGSSSQWWEIWS